MFRQDLNQAIRSFRRAPSLPLAAIGLLVLGVGLNTAVFTFVNTAMIRPFPYPEAERIVTLWETKSERTTGLGWPLTAANLADLLATSRSFALISASHEVSVELAADGRAPMRLIADAVLENYFELLGVPPGLGRTFETDDYQVVATFPYTFQGPPDGRIVAGLGDRAVLSYPLWQEHFGGDPSVIGQTLDLDGGAVTVVGVMPRRFQPVSAQRQIDLWMPYVLNPDGWTNRQNHQLWTVARLRDGVDVDEASKELQAIYLRLEADEAFTNEGWSGHAVPLKSAVLGATETLLPILLAGAGLVLVIACANVASLLLARAAGRSREITTRIALGASVSRILRQLLTESLLLALVAGALSIAVAWGGVRLFRNAPLAMELPFTFEPGFDGRVFLFALSVSVMASLLFGLAPAFHAAELGNTSAWRPGSVVTKEPTSRFLVASQIALTVVLLTVGGLMIRSLWNLSRVDLGFRPDGLLNLHLVLPESRYPSGEPVRRFHAHLLESMTTLPGVRGAATGGVPLSGLQRNFPFTIDGRYATRDAYNAEGAVVSDGFFRVLGIPLLEGRTFARSDGFEQPWVVVINETLAREYWPGEDPIGRLIRIGGAPRSSTIVGVVGDAKFTEPEAQNRQIYLPHSQVSERYLSLHVRTSGDPFALVGSIRARVEALDPRLPLFDVRSVAGLVRDSLDGARLRATLLGLYAIVAVAIAAGGLFGLLSFAVAHRTQEIGLRMALGAGSRQILTLFLDRGLRLALVGTLAGVAAALAVTRLVRSFLFGVGPTDPGTLAAVCSLLVAVALLASYLPARRASKTDPTVALRHE